MTPDDAARNRKMRKMMSLNCSICLMPIFGVGKVYRIWTPKGGPPQFSTWMFVSSFLPFVVSWFLANFLKQRVRSERHVATPKAGLPHAPTRGFGAPVFGLACY